MNTFIKIILLWLILKNIIIADTYEEWYAKGSRIFHQIKNGKIKNTPKNWNKAINYFKKLILKAPDRHPKKTDAYFSIGLCYIQTENYLKAVQNFRMLIKKYPKHRLADDAQYLIGYCFLQMNNIKQAKIEFKRVIKNYPKGDMFKKTLSQLDILYKKYPDKKYQIEFYEYLIKNFDDEYIKYNYTRKLDSLYNSEQKIDTLFQKKLKIKPKYEKGIPKFLTLRISSSEISSRIVLEFDQDVHYKANYIKEKNLLFIDFINSIINIKPINKSIKNGLIKRIKLAQFNPKTVRFVIYFEKELNYHIFTLNNPSRVVIDISQPQIKINDNISLVNQLGLKISTVAIDPGHGGKDPGTVYGKYYEKDIVLNVAKYLLKLFEKDPEFQAFLTRNDDTFLPLEKRTEIANSRNADLFISLHVNFCNTKNIAGIETYYLSLTTDPWAQQLAVLENASTLHKLSELNSLLKDIIINNKIEESKNFAFSVHNQLIRTLRTQDRKVRKAPFVVLIGSDMPAILIEIGYLSNPQERKKLISHKYQRQIAKAIYNGIKKYQANFSYVNQ